MTGDSVCGTQSAPFDKVLAQEQWAFSELLVYPTVSCTKLLDLVLLNCPGNDLFAELSGWRTAVAR